MNKDGFIQKMRADKKSQTTIKRNIKFTGIFEKYLSDVKNKQIENAIPKDLGILNYGERKTNLKIYVCILRASLHILPI
jgi:hypothetical protein